MSNEKLTTDQVPKARRPPPPSKIGRGERALKPTRIPIIPEKSVHTVNTAVKTTTKTTKAPVRRDQVGQIFVIEDPELDVKFSKKVTQGLKEVEDVEPLTCDWIRAFNEFKEIKGDHYDFVAMVPDIHVDKLTNAVLPTGMPQFTPHHVHVFNDVTGIGLDQYRRRGLFHSRRLQGIAALPPEGASERLQRLHEIGHRWAANVDFKKRRSDRSALHDLIDPNSDAHWVWGFHKDGSSLAWTHATQDWVTNSDGSFTQIYVGNSKDSPHYGYCPLDLYLMGMLAPSEVPPFYYIDNPTKAPTPKNPDRFTGRRVNLRVKNIIWAMGPREPHAAYSQRSFRLGCIVLTKDLDEGKKLAASLEQYRMAVTEQFREATRSRGMLDTYLYDSSYDGIYIKHHLDDTGIEPSQGAFWNSPDIWVRNQPYQDDGNDRNETHEDPKPNQDNWIYVRVRNNGWQPPSGKITVNIFQTDPRTEFLYPQDWKWDEEHRIGSQLVDPLLPGGACVIAFKWEWEKIVRLSRGTNGYPTLLVEILPTHPTQTKLRYVWQDRRIAQKNVTVLRLKRTEQEVNFSFVIGANSHPKRSVRIRIQQKNGRHLEKVTLALDKKEKWQSRLKKRGSLQASGGKLIERKGRLLFMITNAHEGAEITLPLEESKPDSPGPESLTLSLNWGKVPLATGAAFEIMQLNEQREVVGGLDLIVKNERSNHI